jgi:hypothetical protein
MTQVETFLGNVNKQHTVYENSILDFPAPEYSTGETVLGSTYRALLLGKSEGEIDLSSIDELPIRIASDRFGGKEVWESILFETGGLVSPQPKGKFAADLSQLMPLVPEVARYGCVLGKPRRRWTPSNMVIVTIYSGCGVRRGNDLIRGLAQALDVGVDDDLFAQFVEQALKSIAPPNDRLSSWQPEDYIHHFESSFMRLGDEGFSPVAERFCKDIKLIIDLKPRLTRRQWTVQIESFLRIGLCMNLLWVCRLNQILWGTIASALAGNEVPTKDALYSKIWKDYEKKDPLLEIGKPSGTLIRRRVGDYAKARIGLNLLLNRLSDIDIGCSGGKIGLSMGGLSGREQALHSLANFVSCVAEKCDRIDVPTGFSLLKTANELCKTRSSLIANESGYTKNMNEFLTYCLGQIQPAQIEFDGYDQAYINRKRGTAKNSRWITRPGPSTLIGLVHATCMDQGDANASIDDFVEHLEAYGLHVPAREVEKGDIANDFEHLGMVIDSPDAGGGRLLVDPFPRGA